MESGILPIILGECSLKRFAILALLSFVSMTHGEDRMTTVDGYCFLEGKSDHSGVKVLFQAQSPSANTDSTFTDNIGAYLINLTEGIYGVVCTKSEYTSYHFPESIYLTGGSFTMPDAVLSPLNVIEINGAVSGYWISGITYQVIGDCSGSKPMG